VVAGTLTVSWAAPAFAGPREDMRSSYGQALQLFNDLEIDKAVATVDQAISAAEAAGAGQDPTLASLYVMKAALLYSTQGDEAAEGITQALTTAVKLNYYVVVPVEVRSEGLTNYLQQAKKYAGAAPSSSIVHDVPDASCGGDIPIEALLGVPDGGQAALYVRRVGATEFQGLSMDVFSNVATGTISAGVHGDEDLEYFIVAFDAQQRAVASFGTKEQPIKLNQGCVAEAPPVAAGTGDGEGGEGGEDGEDGEDGEKDELKPKQDVETTLPRVWINIGLGTGFGIATGTAERTYEQYFPSDEGYQYGAQQYACALARWNAGGIDAGLPNEMEFAQLATTYGPTNLNGGPFAQNITDPGVYDRGQCGRHHPVSTGLASAPFHIEPEIQVRVSKRVSLGLYSRLQVVTGSQVIRDDPNKTLGEPGGCGGAGNEDLGENGTSWCDEVYVTEPRGNFQDKPPFSWTVGLKFRYYFLKDDKKFRLFAGGFAGYGFSRLRVKMGFANDTNGNSVPDDYEGQNGRDGVTGMANTCHPVFPYRGACEDTASPSADAQVGAQFAQNAEGKVDERIDTVRLGPGHIGALFGFNYQIVKNFGLFGELQVGGWFPDSSSVLFDINVGPAITF